jgi:hypothetical protein
MKTVLRSLCWSVILYSTFASANANATDNKGLVDAPGRNLVVAHCSGCHSLKLIEQNRLDRKAWLSTIRWMQESQGLWPLGPAEDTILDYLSEHYAPTASGRRKPIPDHLLPPEN